MSFPHSQYILAKPNSKGFLYAEPSVQDQYSCVLLTNLEDEHLSSNFRMTTWQLKNMETKETDDINSFLLLLTVFNRPSPCIGCLQPSNDFLSFFFYFPIAIFKPLFLSIVPTLY